ARREQRRLVDQIPQIGAREPRRRGGEVAETRLLPERDVTSVDLENRFAPGLVRQVDHHAPVEASGTQQRLVEYVRLVRRGQDYDALPAGEPVHLGEDLVQGLLLLAGPADDHLSSRAADSVQL